MEISADAGSGTATTASILVVDDSRSIRETLVGILRQSGYRVDSAVDGAEAIRKVHALAPDLIVSDLEMPNANGFELLSAVRSDSQLAMVPFIMVTSVSDRSSTRRAMELGADDYLTKPFSPSEVLSIVASRLDKQRSWRQATRALARSYSQGMMAILPHEFRTPLSSILGFAELMAMQAPEGLSPAQTLEFAETIQRAGKRLLSHTTRFLTFLEYQSCPAMPAGSTDISTGWVRTLVDGCLEGQLPTSQVAAVIEIEPTALRCREGLVRNIVQELTGNAVKFARADTAIGIHGRIDEGRYTLQFDNVGRPFPLDRIADVGAFTQFDRDRTEQQGLGVGLAIVAHAARLAGGQLAIENLPGMVVRASVRLPLRG